MFSQHTFGVLWTSCEAPAAKTFVGCAVSVALVGTLCSTSQLLAAVCQPRLGNFARQILQVNLGEGDRETKDAVTMPLSLDGLRTSQAA